MFEPESIIYSLNEFNENAYQKLKSETIEKLNILGNKINICVSNIDVKKDEQILLLLQSIDLIYKELVSLKKDVKTLKECSSNM